MDLTFDRWMQQMKNLDNNNNYSTREEESEQPTMKKKVTYSSKELQARDLAVAYVARNPDGSFTQFKIHKTAVKAVWTTVVAETQSNKNAITDLRLAPLNEWEDPERRKRVIFARAVQVQPNECLCKCLQRQSIENPVLLVCWERAPQTAKPVAHVQCSKRTKEWHYFLFTNGTDTATCKGGPVVLVHSASGTQQLDENGIQSVASSAFIDWITKKAQNERWEIISLTNLSASARVKLDMAQEAKEAVFVG